MKRKIIYHNIKQEILYLSLRVRSIQHIQFHFHCTDTVQAAQDTKQTNKMFYSRMQENKTKI